MSLSCYSSVFLFTFHCNIDICVIFISWSDPELKSIRWKIYSAGFTLNKFSFYLQEYNILYSSISRFNLERTLNLSPPEKWTKMSIFRTYIGLAFHYRWNRITEIFIWIGGSVWKTLGFTELYSEVSSEKNFIRW